MAEPIIRTRRFLQAGLAAAAPGLAVLIGLALFGVIGPWTGLAAIVVTLGLGFALIHPHLRDLMAVEQRADAIAGDDEPALPFARRTPVAAEIVLAMARAQRRVVAGQRALEARALAAESIIDGVPEPLLVLDDRRRVVHANRAAEAVLGDGLVERDLAEVIRHPAVLGAADEALSAGTAGGVDFTLAEPIGREMHARIAPLDRPGQFGESAVVTLQDLTEIRRSEQMRVDFIANVSHELRTPLASLAGFIETLQGPGQDDVEARERFLGLMRDQAARMASLVDDLLSLSRIELEEHNSPAASVDVAAVLHAVGQGLEVIARKNRIDIAVGGMDNPPSVVGDEGQLVQVFRNLIENAIKYGRPETTVNADIALDESAGEPTLAVAIRDRGEGIGREHLGRLTERFYRVDPGRSRDLGGTGLGLAIVKHIVRRHRGELIIESALGVGSRFTVKLPIAKPGDDDDRPEDRHETVIGQD